MHPAGLAQPSPQLRRPPIKLANMQLVLSEDGLVAQRGSTAGVQTQPPFQPPPQLPLGALGESLLPFDSVDIWGHVGRSAQAPFVEPYSTCGMLAAYPTDHKFRLCEISSGGIFFPQYSNATRI